jgi:hypothetical protein
LRLVDPEAVEVWEPDPAEVAGEIDAMDALVELFIGEQAGESDGDPGSIDEDGFGGEIGETASGAPALEALITGHLPVRGAVWVRAYAARVASTTGSPVALVRVTPERTSVELVGSSAEADPVPEIGTAIRAAACAADRFLLHFDELDQAGMIHAGALDTVTILSGADEPAIVSAYRLIKSIVEEGEPSAGVGIAIVGADAASSARASTRLVQATRQFLGMDLAVRPGVARVQSAATTLLGHTDRRLEPAEVLALILESSDPEAEAATKAPHEPGPVQAPAEAARDIPVETPSPGSMVEGLRSLGLPCPVAPSVEMAMDGAGRLHLLAWWSPEAASALMRAAAWARLNLPLLAKVRPGLDAAQEGATQHLLCTDPGIATGLHGASAAIHLALPAAKAAAPGWLCGRVN